MWRDVLQALQHAYARLLPATESFKGDILWNEILTRFG